MPDPLAALAERGAHFVLCGADKRPRARRWQEKAPALKVVLRHQGLVGVVPASLGCVVIDVDEGGEQACADVVATLGRPLTQVATRRAGGAHLWYRSRDAAGIGNRGWAHGDVRGAKGYAILWDAAAVAEGLAGKAPVADLLAAELDQLPPKSSGGGVGERNDTLNRHVYLATRAGAPIEPHIEAARARGLSEREIQATVASAVAAGDRDGRRVLIPDAYTAAGLAVALDVLGVGLRLNTRAKRYEYLVDGAWQVADDERDAWLRQAITGACSVKKGSTVQRLKYSSEAFLEFRRALGNGVRIDPFRDWLETLPAWDGVPRIDGLLTEMFGAEDDTLSRWASCYVGIGAVQRAYKPGCKLDEIPVLLGEQGCGKSAFVRCWFSEDQHEWHGDAVDLGARPKEQAEQMAGRVVCELSELTGIRKAELERLKAFITRQDDGQFRWAYARSPVPSPRMCVFVGTTNEAECLPNDPSGNRRFVVVELQHGCDVEAASALREHWWAEALSRYRAGERANLPREHHALAAERAKEHRETDSLEQEITDAVHDLLPQFSVNDLYYALPGNGGAKPPDKVMQMRISAALKNLGFRGLRKRQGGARAVVWSR